MFFYKQIMVIIQIIEKLVIFVDLDIILNLVDYNFQKREIVWVIVSNVIIRIVRVLFRAIIVEIQLVIVEDILEFFVGDNMFQVVDFNIV